MHRLARTDRVVAATQLSSIIPSYLPTITRVDHMFQMVLVQRWIPSCVQARPRRGRGRVCCKVGKRKNSKIIMHQSQEWRSLLTPVQIIYAGWHPILCVETDNSPFLGLFTDIPSTIPTGLMRSTNIFAISSPTTAISVPTWDTSNTLPLAHSFVSQPP